MSPSLLVYDGRHESFRDSDLFAVVALLEYLIGEGDIDDGLRGAVAEWKAEAVASGAGAILFDFSAFGAGTPMHSSLKSALASAETYIKRTWGMMFRPRFSTATTRAWCGSRPIRLRN